MTTYRLIRLGPTEKRFTELARTTARDDDTAYLRLLETTVKHRSVRLPADYRLAVERYDSETGEYEVLEKISVPTTIQ